jgi:hypothetical protein
MSSGIAAKAMYLIEVGLEWSGSAAARYRRAPGDANMPADRCPAQAQTTEPPLPLIIPALAILLTLSSMVPAALAAQYPIDRLGLDRLGLGALVTLASPAEDRMRVDQILGLRGAEGFLTRSASSLSFPDRSGSAARAEISVLAPEIRWIHNSELPYTFNDGALWAGKGHNFQITTGVRAQFGRIELVVAPEIGRSENREYQVLPYLTSQSPPRSRFASRWYDGRESIDMPTRFGEEPIARFGPGQSSLAVDFGALAAGVATENLWWGPGLRNALVLSSHAGGVPHLFLKTDRPAVTPLGTFEGRWIAGRLTESGYFDGDPANDERTLAGLVVSFTPAAEPDLSLGVARTVQRRRSPGSFPLAAPFDVLRSIGRPNSAGEAEIAGYDADQVFALFGRWIFPEHGFESWFEWARFEEPASLRDLLVAPNHSQGYTVGLQYARPVGIPAVVRVQSEISYLEPSSTFKERPVFSAYTSRAVEHGYTQRGQVLGASIGPGASSQYVGADLLADRWRVGAFAARIRWNEGALVRLDPPSILSHEISIIAGVRAGLTFAGLQMNVDIAREGRLNYMFQNPILGLDRPEGVDISNLSLGLTIGPAPRAR